MSILITLALSSGMNDRAAEVAANVVIPVKHTMQYRDYRMDDDTEITEHGLVWNLESVIGTVDFGSWRDIKSSRITDSQIDTLTKAILNGATRSEVRKLLEEML